MKILLTNDDGILAAGIQALRAEFEALTDAEVTIVAPDRERSGSGHSITFHTPLRVSEVSFPGSRVIGHAVNGTPSDCVKLAVKAIMTEAPDLVISGINNGPNLGTDILYSGTVSAAIEGALQGIPSLAVSLAAFEHFDYQYAARFTAYLARHILRAQLPPHTLLNVNIPPGSVDSLTGITIAKLGVRQYANIFDRRVDPHGRAYYWLAGDLMDTSCDRDEDICAVNNGRVSITPVHFDLTNYGMMQELSTWGLSLAGWPDRG